MEVNKLKLLVSKSCLDFGARVDKHLQLIRESENLVVPVNENGDKTFVVPMDEPIFSNGESKGVLRGSVRGCDVYYLTDVNNWGITYPLHGAENHMSPQDHFHNITSAVGAVRGDAARLTVIETILYESRQHRRKARESLDCAIALQELERLGVDRIMTIDVHDPEVQNAIPTTPFNNLYPSHYIMTEFLENEDIDYKKMIAISPDAGAIERTTYYANILSCPMGMFNKRRDYSKVTNGKNKIVAHDYIGRPVRDKNAFVVDDMIASGGSILDTATRLKKSGANKVYFIAAFGLFTEGMAAFDRAYEQGLFEGIYVTNATYIPEEYQRSYLHIVDVSRMVAEIIDAMNREVPISDLLKGTEQRKALALEVLNRKRK